MATHRGISIGTNECVYGYRIGEDVIVGEIVEWDDQYFCTEFWQKVYPETICRNSEMSPLGMEDDIYEGDVFDRPGFWSFFIAFEAGAFVKVPCDNVQRINHEHPRLELETLTGWNRVGNIHNNPELLKA